jgi:hypothetical protein
VAVQDLDDQTRVSDSRIELVLVLGTPTILIAGLAATIFYATATLKGNNVGQNTLPQDEKHFRKARVDNSEPAHNICFRGSSATNRLTNYGNGLERSEPRENFRV